MKIEQYKKLESISQFIGKKDADHVLPVWIHLLDTGSVMGYLFDMRVSEQEKRFFCEETGSDEKTRSLFVLAALLHDIGKLTSSFQYKILSGTGLTLSGFTLAAGHSDAYHSFLSMLILQKLGYPEFFASLAGAHHGKTQSVVGPKLQQKLKYYKEDLCADAEENWLQTWNLVNTTMKEIAGIAGIPNLTAPKLLIMAGYLSDADWLASNTNYYPLLEIGETLSYSDFQLRQKTALSKIGLPRVWAHLPVSTLPLSRQFLNSFGFTPNEMQQETMNIASRIQHPGLLIIEAPMGMGKTEAALQAANTFCQKTGAGGVFFGLPTQATANGLLDRFKDWTSQESELPVLFSLAHGNASLNDDFARLPDSLNSAESNEDNKLIAHQWLQQSRLRLFSDFVIGTVDTALLAAFSHRYVAFRHAGLAGKVVIIDEVHSYDAYMQVFLTLLLRWLGTYKVPVILLSATLPAEIKTKLLNSYLTGETGKDPQIQPEHDPSYPSITWTEDGKVFRSDHPMTVSGQAISLERSFYMDEEEEICQIESLFKKNLAGGCGAVIINSVAKSQDVAQTLKQAMPDHEIVNFHSRFTQSDRQKLEQEILTRTGKNSTPSDRNKFIVVGTQVLEQSLDVDFDYMISELAPMDLLLQRMGRLHRHKRAPRPTPIFTVLDRKEDYDPASSAIYDSFILRLTRNALPDKVNLPEDIPTLVSAVYDHLDSHDPDAEKFFRKQDELTHKAQEFGLYVSRKSKRKNYGLNDLMQTTIDNMNKAEGYVRHTTLTLECIAIKNVHGIITSPDQTPFSWQDSKYVSPQDMINEMLTKTIRIPVLDSDYQKLETQLDRIQTETQLRPALPPLLKNKHLLILDENGHTQIENIHFLYDSEFGIQIQKQ